MNVISINESHETFRVNSPLYRVNFWEKPRPGYGWNLDAYLLEQCPDVTQALLWALGEARGRRFQLFASIEETVESDTLICLFGDDPNSEAVA